MRRMRSRAGTAAVATVLGAGLLAAPLIATPAFAADDTTTLNLIGINDFHGRIDANTVKFAGTVEGLKDQHPDSTVFVSAGDNYGASLFASAVQDDEPTIDVLNALGLQASAVGNHEFDRGYDDLVGRAPSRADWDYLGANVYHAGTDTPALPEYSTVQVGGLTVGIIGAVTQETPSLVAPAGIANLDFGDPVDAVNRVATQLTDGNLDNGEADVLVAAYHEGAPEGTPDGASLDDELAASPVFAKIAKGTSPRVSAIFTGHTHKQYAWDVPLADGSTRPIIQTGSYGANVGQITLTVDNATKKVVEHTVQNHARVTTDDATLVAEYPAVAKVEGIVNAALAYADKVGNDPVGSVAADITTAFTPGEYVDGIYQAPADHRDDRSSESTLGNLIADSLVDSLSSPERGGAEIGVVNPGGIRSELYAAPDGVITYAQANAVLPFLNNLWTTSLTGAQFKAVLEEQWQADKDGTPITTRPFLNLGLSSNVSYMYDATRDRGDHITSITVNGKPIEADHSYRIGSFSFLLEGGDNFWEFQNGTDTRDSGLVDRDGWIAYLTGHPDLAPSFARRGVQVVGAPATAERGSSVSFQVKNLNLTSLGSPANTALEVSLDGDGGPVALAASDAPQQAGLSVPVSAADPAAGSWHADGTGQANGTATVTFTVPQQAADASTIVLTAQPSGTTVRVPLAVTSAPVVVVPPSNPPQAAPGQGGPAAPHGQLAASGSDPLGALAGVGGILALGILLLAAESRRRSRTR